MNGLYGLSVIQINLPVKANKHIRPFILLVTSQYTIHRKERKQMNKTELLITPAEAIRLSHTRTISDFDIVKDLTAEFEKDLTADDVEENQWFYSMCLLSAIWNAGRIQGIREERKKKNISISAETPARTVSIPVLNIKQMSDYQWQLNALNSRLEHPELYEASENVEESIEHLRKWLEENKDKAEE